MLNMFKMVSFITNNMEGKIQFSIFIDETTGTPVKIILKRIKCNDLVITRKGTSYKDIDVSNCFETYYLKFSTIKEERRCIKAIREYIKKNSQ